MFKDIQISQEHRKKIETNYQEEIQVLNSKIAQLNEYIEDLEQKYNKKVKEEFTSPTVLSYKYIYLIFYYRKAGNFLFKIRKNLFLVRKKRLIKTKMSLFNF